MKITLLATSILYALAALISIIFGSVYLFRSRFMPYHQEAIGIQWEELDQRMQALFIGLMRTVGGGLLGVGISIAILLLIPFRAGETWSI